MEFHEQFMRGIYLETLSIGNIYRENAGKIVEFIFDIFDEKYYQQAH